MILKAMKKNYVDFYLIRQTVAIDTPGIGIEINFTVILKPMF